MSKNSLKIAGFVGLGLAAISIFVAWERYSANAKAFEEANRMMQQMTGQFELKPSVPAATTYSLLFAAVSGIAGVACFVASGSKQK